MKLASDSSVTAPGAKRSSMSWTVTTAIRMSLCATVASTVLASVTQAQTRLAESLSHESLEQLADESRRFGNPSRGALAFFHPELQCAKCHQPTAKRRRLGPDLTQQRNVTMAHLIDSVLRPSAVIHEGYESVSVETEDGKVISGVLVSKDDQHVIVDGIERANQPWKIAQTNVHQLRKLNTSAMPTDLANQLTDRREFLDLAAYLFEIAKNGPSRAAELRPIGATDSLPPLPEYESHLDHAALIGQWDEQTLAMGEELYKIRCASCHGTIEHKGSMPASLRFASGKFKNGNDPYRLYQTLTHGFGMMIPQRWMVPQQKYAVIQYVREHFVKRHNPSEYFEISDAYLAGLPQGDTLGPKPVLNRPWTQMDYGPSLNNTIEVSDDQSNIAQKGIAIRLDDGPGGVESGTHWMMYEHDTLRVAGAWSGKFIDWEGIHFNGTHGRHPKVAGDVAFANPTGPGFANPTADASSRFEDSRVTGRDGKQYGPLPRSWAHYLGLYRFGKRTILKYRVGTTEILETPALTFIDEIPVYTRTLNLGPTDKEIIIQVARTDERTARPTPDGIACVPSAWNRSKQTGPETPRPTAPENRADAKIGLDLDGATFAEIKNGDQLDMSDSDYSICARIKTKTDGTLFAKTKSQAEWVPQGISFFLRGGRPTLDIGWVGAVHADRTVRDGQWHDVAMTWQARTGQVRFYIDGKPAGSDKLAPKSRLRKSVIRIGFTNDNFPNQSCFQGNIQYIRFYQRRIPSAEMADPRSIADDRLMGTWQRTENSQIPNATGDPALSAVVNSRRALGRQNKEPDGLFAACSDRRARWTHENGNLRLTIPPGGANRLVIALAPVTAPQELEAVQQRFQKRPSAILHPEDLTPFTNGGPPNYPEKIGSTILRGEAQGGFAVDTLTRPTENPWNAQLRLTGLDFLPDGDTAVISTWDGSVWRVTGLQEDQLQWQRIAAGLFQPLGIRYHARKIYVTCRDQIVVLHDLNGDHEADWYENFNSDHQVTEHFHEFAMGLQTDQAGNFYYAKSARHAKTAVVPHHGTLLKVSPDGAKTSIIATGFRAANGVCLNPDGSFVVTDQEGHWNPKNRINWVQPGGFYGNMFGYHDVTDESDSAMEPPLCWITNAFDRSPSELMWIDSPKWGALKGSLLNFSYGYGKIYLVPFETVKGQVQGGMCALPIRQFPTGIMRGRFHPVDGQLYCCGMFAWAGTQQQPGGLYRVRRTDQAVHLPTGLHATRDGIAITFSDSLDPDSARDLANWKIKTWDLKRTKNYGSEHYNEKTLPVTDVNITKDNQTVRLTIPRLKPTWGMEIMYSLKSPDGNSIQGQIHNTIHHMGTD